MRSMRVCLTPLRLRGSLGSAMARPLRLEYPGALWHVTSRGNERRAIFMDDEDRERFLSQLARAVDRFGWIVHAWVLMTNHFHLVIETPQCTLSRGMHWLGGLYAQSFNRRHGRVGHLFQGRFKGILVDSDEYFLEIVRYTVLNPVRAGMVETAADYQWSSFRATAGLAPAPRWLTTEAILSRLATTTSEAQALYRSFVDEGLGVSSPWEKLSGQMYVGGAAFLTSVQEKIDQTERSDEHPRAMARARLPLARADRRCGLSELRYGGWDAADPKGRTRARSSGPSRLALWPATPRADRFSNRSTQPRLRARV